MSLSGNPASRKRCAIASAATVTLPIESVVLISINCLKISTASFREASSAGVNCCACIETVSRKQTNTPNRHFPDPTSILRTRLRQLPNAETNRLSQQKPSSPRQTRLAQLELRCRTPKATFPIKTTARLALLFGIFFLSAPSTPVILSAAKDQYNGLRHYSVLFLHQK